MLSSSSFVVRLSLLAVLLACQWFCFIVTRDQPMSALVCPSVCFCLFPTQRQTVGSLIPSSCMKANSLPAIPVGREEEEEDSNEAGKCHEVCDG